MDQALVLAAVRHLAFEPLPSRAPASDEVLIRTLYSGVSAGTELSQYRGTSPFMTRSWDADRRVFRDGDPSWTFPVRNLGYEEVGRIEEVGSGVDPGAARPARVRRLEPPQHAHDARGRGRGQARSRGRRSAHRHLRAYRRGRAERRA